MLICWKDSEKMLMCVWNWTTTLLVYSTLELNWIECVSGCSKIILHASIVFSLLLILACKCLIHIFFFAKLPPLPPFQMVVMAPLFFSNEWRAATRYMCKKNQESQLFMRQKHKTDTRRDTVPLPPFQMAVKNLPICVRHVAKRNAHLLKLFAYKTVLLTYLIMHTISTHINQLKHKWHPHQRMYFWLFITME